MDRSTSEQDSKDDATTTTRTIRWPPPPDLRGVQDAGLSSQYGVLSERRWIVMGLVSLFGLLHTTTSDISAILHLILELLDLPVQRYIFLNQLFSYSMVLLAVPTAALVDRYGIKASMRCAACLFMLNGCLNALLYMPQLANWSRFRMAYYILARLVDSEVYTIFFIMPLKVSETWFPVSERSFAWAFMHAQMSLSSCITSFLFPRLMQQVADIELLAQLSLAFPLLNVLAVFGLLTQAAPDQPPSERVAIASNCELAEAPLWQSVKKMLTNGDILVSIAHHALFLATTMAPAGVLQDILTSKGHSEIFAGNLMSANALATLLLTLAMATFVHKLTNETLVCKFASAAQGGFFIILVAALILNWPGWLLIIISMGFNLAKSWASPNFNNMTAQVTCGVVPQATIVGFSMSITVIVMSIVQIFFAGLIEKLNEKQNNYTLSLTFAGALCLLNVLLFVFFFKGPPAPSAKKNSRDAATTTIEADFERNRSQLAAYESETQTIEMESPPENRAKFDNFRPKSSPGFATNCWRVISVHFTD